MKNYKIGVLKGDGIGPEIVDEGLKVIEAISAKYGYKFDIIEGIIGGSAIDKVGIPLPEETIEMCKNSDAVLMGAVGGPKWDNVPSEIRPEKGLLKIRQELELFANIRPAKIYPSMIEASPIKTNIIKNGVDIVIIRELTGGIYFGEKGLDVDKQITFDREEYTYEQIDRIARKAFEFAIKRGKKVTSVDKANVLETSRLWRKVVNEVHKEYEEVILEHIYVDNAAMQLIRRPSEFDVILTNNMFGDILSDEAAIITGSIGMLPSASMGRESFGLYEPIHGSAPDIAGKNIANPIATILSIAMMMRHSFGLEDISKDIEYAVEKVLQEGFRTADLLEEKNSIKVTTSEMGELICSKMLKI